MKTQNTFYISGLTCKNCAEKVKAALKGHVTHLEISSDLSQVTIKNNVIDIFLLNHELAKIGNYKIGDAAIAQLNDVVTTNNNNNNVTNIDSFATYLVTYKPLILVFSFILLVCFCVEIADGNFVLHRFMPNFMAGFFLVFSFFKLLDLTGFANSYAMYDVIAKRFPVYGFIYPFIEVGLGAAYILAPSHALTSTVTLIVMLVSLIGVVQAVLSRQKIKCACLGTGFNLPMSTVTIIEDSLMAAMAAWMLI